MSECVFCNKTMFEERIIAENDDFYVIATLGQITDGGYILIFPKRHVRCMGALTHKEMVGFTSLLQDAKSIVALEYDLFPVIFEHGIVGQTIPHAHIHLVPAKVNLVKQITDDFREVTYESFDIFAKGVPQQSEDALRPYLLWCSPKEYQLAHIWWNPVNVPAQYFRTILAEKLGRSERANWRAMDTELDKRFWTETVKRLSPYFN